MFRCSSCTRRDCWWICSAPPTRTANPDLPYTTRTTPIRTASPLVARRHVCFLFFFDFGSDTGSAKNQTPPKARSVSKVRCQSDVERPLAACAILLPVIDMPQWGFSNISLQKWGARATVLAGAALLRSCSHGASVSRKLVSRHKIRLQDTSGELTFSEKFVDKRLRIQVIALITYALIYYSSSSNRWELN